MSDEKENMFDITGLIDEHKIKLAQVRLLIVFTAGLKLKYFSLFIVYVIVEKWYM